MGFASSMHAGAAAAAALELCPYLVWAVIDVLGDHGEISGVSDLHAGAGVHNLCVMAGAIH